MGVGMGAIVIPSTVVVCATATARTHHESGPVPLTWVAGLDVIGGLPTSACVALDLAPDAFSSRQVLRGILHEALQHRPDLTSIVADDVPLRHRGVLTEAGIRVAVVRSFTDPERGSRRPAPAGWTCRSVTWGLWEVLLSPATRGWRRLLSGSPLPRVQAGTLAVVHAHREPSATAAPPLPECLAWAARARAGRGAVLATLPVLADMLERGGHAAPDVVGGSVLRAA
jgi:hypothetical protein